MNSQSSKYLLGSHLFPTEDEITNESPNQDTDDEIPIVIHSEQHDEVRHPKLDHMQKRPDHLLEKTRPELPILLDFLHPDP